jgi:hypothetical protein
MTKLFPLKFEAQLLLTDGNQSAVATIGMGNFTVPTEAKVQEAVEKAIVQIDAQLPGFRPMLHAEVWDYVIAEKTGSNMLFATPALGDGEVWWRVELPEIVSAAEQARWARGQQFDEEDE